MTALIILGTVNRFTFANSIIAANAKAKEIFNTDLRRIYTIHTERTLEMLRPYADWKEHAAFSIPNDVEYVLQEINISTHSQESIEHFAHCVESIAIDATEGDNIIVDLTCGTSMQRNLLSISAYVLSLQHQYMIDIQVLSNITTERGFLSADVLLPSYVRSPASIYLEGLYYLNPTKYIQHELKEVLWIVRNCDLVDEINQESIAESIRLYQKGRYLDSLRIVFPSIEAITNEMLFKIGRSPTEFRGLVQKMQFLERHRIIPVDVSSAMEIVTGRNKVVHGNFSPPPDYVFPLCLLTFRYLKRLLSEYHFPSNHTS